MDKKSKIFLWIFFLLIIASIGVTFWRIMLKKDYVVDSQIDCDPYTEACFVWKCDPNSNVDGEKCTGDATKDTWYYKLATRNASKIPLCDPAKDDTCKPWDCTEPSAAEPGGEKDCSQTLCDDKTKVDQKVDCSDPVQYTKDNPVEDNSTDATACDPESEDCAAADSNSTDPSADSADATSDTSADTTSTDSNSDTNTTPTVTTQTPDAYDTMSNTAAANSPVK